MGNTVSGVSSLTISEVILSSEILSNQWKYPTDILQYLVRAEKIVSKEVKPSNDETGAEVKDNVVDRSIEYCISKESTHSSRCTHH